MNTSLVFGENLRLLCAAKPSVASVARDLEINRVQFNRYLKSESFPKPAVLKRICNYFEVDARIFTEPLNARELVNMPAPANGAVGLGKAEAVHNGLRYAICEGDRFVPYEHIPDGIHSIWRQAFSNETHAVHLLLQFKTIGGARVIRGFDSSKLFRSHTARFGFNAREFRGVILNQQDGFAFLYFNRQPTLTVGSSYFSTAQFYSTGLLTGFSVLHRNEYKGMRRLSRSVLQFLPQTTHQILKAARIPSLLEMSQVPENIRDLIAKRLT